MMDSSLRSGARWLLLILLLIVLPIAAHAQDEITDDEVNAIAKDLYCPVCESTPLDVCPTQACADWRELIRTKLSQGESRQDILEYFARQYGDGVLANPPRRGISLIILWVLPVLGVLLGLLLFAWLLRSLRGAAPPTAPAGGPSSASGRSKATTVKQPSPTTTGNDLDDYIARIERELDQQS